MRILEDMEPYFGCRPQAVENAVRQRIGFISHNSNVTLGLKIRKPERRLPVFAVPNNVQKQKARPKRSITNPGDDHSAGLWVNYDFLRRHQASRSEAVLHSPHAAVNNRYLELADLALGLSKPKKKSKAENGSS